jgi:hypothetical protein
MGRLDPGGEAKLLGADMHRAADADGAERDRSRLCLGVRDELLNGLPGAFLRHDHDIGAGADHQHRGKVLGRVERQVRKDRRRNGERGGMGENAVAVRVGLGDLTGAERAAGADAIFDHDGLAEFRRKPVEHQPRHHVGGAACAERNGRLDQVRGPVIRRCGSSCEKAGQDANNAKGPGHQKLRFHHPELCKNHSAIRRISRP